MEDYNDEDQDRQINHLILVIHGYLLFVFNTYSIVLTHSLRIGQKLGERLDTVNFVNGNYVMK